MAQVGPKLAPSWPKLAQDGPQIGAGRPTGIQKLPFQKTIIFITFFNIFGGPRGPRWPQMAPGWPQDGPRWPKTAQDGPKMAPR